MPDPIPECCLCDDCQKFKDFVQLAEHLCRKHAGKKHVLRTGNPWHYLLVHPGISIDCWCEEDNALFYTAQEFANHLLAHGGLQAHLLEIALLVPTE